MIRNHLCIITIYFSFLIHSTLASPRLHFCRHYQRDALLEFRNEFPTAESFPSSWNKSSDCCFWEGVKCDDQSGQVISLDLSGKSLKGSLKTNSSLFKLQYLRDLSLRVCNLQGEIPSSLGNLSRLTQVDLSFNQLVGEIPISIGNLNQLRYLKLKYNRLRGEIPSSLGNLSHLTLVELPDNQLVGEIPISIGNLKELRIIWLADNKELFLENNKFEGTIPDVFVNATKLVSLDVSHNNLEGKFPKSLINCKYLRFVNVEGNLIKDRFPSWLGSLPSLQVLILRSNEFYGPLYHDHMYIGFQSLRVIDISDNDFTGTLPHYYFLNWRAMTTSTEESEEEYMENFGYYSRMYQSMEMVNKGVETTFERIRKDFISIDFSGNRIYGKIPESISFMKGLRLLNLSGNAFTGGIPQALANLTNLETLDLSSNKLSGQIPQDLGNLSFLSYMNFSHNFLQGPVPRSTQFQRQKCSSFLDNPGLYGFEEICQESHFPSSPTSHQSEELSEAEEKMFSWIAAAIAFGPGLFCGLVMGHIFTSHNQEWFTEKFGPRKIRVVTSAR
ncbi:hypothetical protein Bca4012_101634 [Brassica carinata]